MATAHQTRRTTRKSPARTLVAIVASAGGVEAISTILSGLPIDLPAAVAIVQHRPTASRNSLVTVLQRATGLPVKLAEEGESLFTSMVYLAPPDAHLTVLVDGSVRLVDGPRIRYVLSSANPLFESAPDAFGANVIAVVLTGCNLDGTDGVQRVAEAGGSVIAEDPLSADHARMPQSAIASGDVQYVLPLSAIASRIVQLVEEGRPST